MIGTRYISVLGVLLALTAGIQACVNSCPLEQSSKTSKSQPNQAKAQARYREAVKQGNATARLVSGRPSANSKIYGMDLPVAKILPSAFQKNIQNTAASKPII
jgi:hypothetical protein